jgi:hypothetical protein
MSGWGLEIGSEKEGGDVTLKRRAKCGKADENFCCQAAERKSLKISTCRSKKAWCE